ncbi:MAG: hypothetical protein ABMA64_28085 [Myxococcota bacterium]
MLLRWLAVVGWISVALASTAALGVVAVTAGPIPEWGHLVGHVALCAGCSALVMAAAGGSPRARAAAAFGASMAFGAAIELVQMRVGRLSADTLFDLAMDALGAALGLCAWASVHRGRDAPIGHALSWLLHPLWVAPIGWWVVTYAASRSLRTATGWTAVAALCLAPALAVWAFGVVARWWSDADLSERADRGPLFAVGAAGMVALAAAAHARGGLAADLALPCALGAAVGAVATRAGLKVSGHVAIPAALGLLIVPWSARGPLPALGVAVVLSWARVAAGRHRPVEVAAGWAVAGITALAAAALG